MQTRTDELRQREREKSAREAIVHTLGSDPWERIEGLREAGRRKAEAQGVAYQMERERKALLARIASEYARTHAEKNLSEAKLDRLARADERYQRHLEGTASAIEERELATSEYFAIRSVLEWDRAAVAHENALSRLEEPTGGMA